MTDFLPIGLPRYWLKHHAGWLLRALIITGVLLTSVILARCPSWRYLALLAAAGAVVLFLRWPPMGLAVLISANFIAPWALGTGSQTELHLGLLLLCLLLALWLLDMLVVRRQVSLLPSRPILPLLALVLTATLAFVAGQLRWFLFAQPAPLPAQLSGLAIFWLSAGAFLLAAHQVHDLRWLARLTWLFLTLGGLFVLARLLPGPVHSLVQMVQKGATGSLFWTWLVALAFSQAAFNRDLRRSVRLALGGLVLGTFYVGLSQARAWASGWLPPLAALAVVLWAGEPRLGLLAALASGVSAAFSMPRVISLVMVGDQQYSLITRWEAWRILAQIVRVNPLLGLGPANYYHYTLLYPILGWTVNFNSHNQYVDLVAQTGLLGLACFMWFAWAVGRLAWGLRSHAPQGFARSYVLGALGGLAGTLVAGLLADWVLPFVYNIGLAGLRASTLGWLFLGGLVAVERLGGAPQGQE